MQIKLDTRQKEIEKTCYKIALSIQERGIFSKVQLLLAGKKEFSGVYMYGDVGRGKTLLMHRFYESLSVRKKLVHFQKFMHDLHMQLHEKKLALLAKEIAQQVRVICLDEFEIKDITDAMLVLRLFRMLTKQGVFIFLTTNTAPDDLYKDGLQRESFLPFIVNVKKEFEVIELNAQKDYRYEAIATNIRKRVLYPFNVETKSQINKIKSELCNEDEISESSINVFSRETKFKKTHQNILFTDFAELFERDLSYADYVEICKHFEIIVLESVRIIKEDENNIITRFINFIDNVYFYRKLLFVELEDEPEKIYKKGKKFSEFKRSISRLNEMNSVNYLKTKQK